MGNIGIKSFLKLVSEQKVKYSRSSSNHVGFYAILDEGNVSLPPGKFMYVGDVPKNFKKMSLGYDFLINIPNTARHDSDLNDTIVFLLVTYGYSDIHYQPKRKQVKKVLKTMSTENKIRVSGECAKLCRAIKNLSVDEWNEFKPDYLELIEKRFAGNPERGEGFGIKLVNHKQKYKTEIDQVVEKMHTTHLSEKPDVDPGQPELINSRWIDSLPPIIGLGQFARLFLDKGVCIDQSFNSNPSYLGIGITYGPNKEDKNLLILSPHTISKLKQMESEEKEIAELKKDNEHLLSMQKLSEIEIRKLNKEILSLRSSSPIGMTLNDLKVIIHSIALAWWRMRKFTRETKAYVTTGADRNEFEDKFNGYWERQGKSLQRALRLDKNNLQAAEDFLTFKSEFLINTAPPVKLLERDPSELKSGDTYEKKSPYKYKRVSTNPPTWWERFINRIF